MKEIIKIPQTKLAAAQAGLPSQDIGKCVRNGVLFCRKEPKDFSYMVLNGSTR